MKVLITGGTGLIGQELTRHLMSLGFSVSYLSRKTGYFKGIQCFNWDINNKTIDYDAFSDVDVLIHLAGANIGEKPWTVSRKKELLFSRIESTQLLVSALKSKNLIIPQIICASAIGYYGDTGNNWVNENSPSGKNFQSEVTVAWEKATDELSAFTNQLTRLRTGVVLSNLGGALPKMKMTAKWGLGGVGSGEQWVPWIHIDDICQLFIWLISKPEFSGTFNAVAPYPATYNELNQCLAAAMGKNVWSPNAPGFLIKLILGEMAQLVLGSIRAEPSKLNKLGFRFRYPQIKEAIQDLIKRGV